MRRARNQEAGARDEAEAPSMFRLMSPCPPDVGPLAPRRGVPPSHRRPSEDRDDDSPTSSFIVPLPRQERSNLSDPERADLPPARTTARPRREVRRATPFRQEQAEASESRPSLTDRASSVDDRSCCTRRQCAETSGSFSPTFAPPPTHLSSDKYLDAGGRIRRESTCHADRAGSPAQASPGSLGAPVGGRDCCPARRM